MFQYILPDFYSKNGTTLHVPLCHPLFNQVCYHITYSKVRPFSGLSSVNFVVTASPPGLDRLENRLL